ncbi:hypothetical protein RZS08_49080, partial [Arthrospira platensis SPKY1]|nr:hypothetical protein [Arthrospira platensis SPKY1]
RRRRQLGRVEHDRVPAPAVGQRSAQEAVGVGLDHLAGRRVEAVEPHVILHPGQRRARRVHARHRPGAAGQRRHREAAGVAVGVEHGCAAELPHQVREAGPVVA